ncbi:YihY family inner membrane protein [Marinimicrobium alkaliphilum]|uniref:YihY family inner membrane protein n=1 Tax=Marinimicrobium alkaliphilum TaxID=2202654 RepID=UPI001300BB23|nr:YihY family inner membrane protein [Marinimicrobium alkaliphilum]
MHKIVVEKMAQLRFFGWRAKQFVVLLGQIFVEKSCQKSAASLTYVTLFALVPLMTVTYSMFTVIPAFHDLADDLQQMLFAHVVPETGQELVNYLQDFSEQARRLTVVGVAFLVGAAYLMLKNIEKNFNAIWGVEQGRRGLMSFLLYWAVLSLGPLLLGIGLGMSTYLVSVRMMVDEYDPLGLITWVFELVPWLLSAATFTLLFAAVPNTRVPFGHAVLGGIVTSIGFEVLKRVFGLIVTHSSLTFIYGAFAMVPLFLLWINFTWMLVLAGAVFVRTIGSYQVMIKDKGYPDLLAGLLVLWHFYQKAALTGEGISDRQLQNIGLSGDQWQRIRSALLRHHVVTITDNSDLVLSRDLHQLSLRELANILSMTVQMPDSAKRLDHLPWYESAAARLGAIDAFTVGQLDASVADLFESGEQDDTEAN